MNISNLNILQIHRGDSMELIPFINCGTEMNWERYSIQENDVIYFALMEVHQKFEDAILKKVFDFNSEKTEDGDLIIKIKPSDTVDLLSGKYYYTIKMKQATEEDSYNVITLLKETEFWIL